MAGMVSRVVDATQASLIQQGQGLIYRPQLEAMVKACLTAASTDASLTAGQWQTDLANELSSAAGDAAP